MTDRTETAPNKPPVPVRVMIVDDHPLFRAGVQQAFEYEEDIEVVAVCEQGEDVLPQVEQDQPDVVLLDVNLPGMNGLQVARQLQTQGVETRVVILTAYHDDEQVIHAMRSGAAAYCSKNVHPDLLTQIVRDVAAGYYRVDDRRMRHPELLAWLDARIEDTTGPHVTDAEGHFIPLSPREMEILTHVTHGLINKEIATRLGISQQTVKNHMTSILKKLHVKDRTQAAVTALRRGWVRIDTDSTEQELDSEP